MNNIEVIQELYRTFREQDYDAFQIICPPDLEWIKNEGFPRGSTYGGVDAVVEGVFKAFNQNWDSWRFQIEEYLEAGHSIIVLGFYEGIHRVSRKSFRWLFGMQCLLSSLAPDVPSYCLSKLTATKFERKAVSRLPRNVLLKS